MSKLMNKFKVGQLWINDRDYVVKILDVGTHELWLLYIENGVKTAWDVVKFLQEYTIWENVKP